MLKNYPFKRLVINAAIFYGIYLTLRVFVLYPETSTQQNMLSASVATLLYMGIILGLNYFRAKRGGSEDSDTDNQA
jgi:hypothetical protein